MSKLTKSTVTKDAVEPQKDALLIDEFEIVELEDRLELAGRCNRDCRGQVAAV